MKRQNLPATLSPETLTRSTGEDDQLQPRGVLLRRSFLKGLGVTWAALSAGALLTTVAGAEERSGSLTQGDAAILRFLAAAEIIESDLWLNPPIPNYPTSPTGGSPTYTNALNQLDGDMAQYIHAYLASKGVELCPRCRHDAPSIPQLHCTGRTGRIGCARRYRRSLDRAGSAVRAA